MTEAPGCLFRPLAYAKESASGRLEPRNHVALTRPFALKAMTEACKDFFHRKDPHMRVCQIAPPTTVEREFFSGFLAAGPVPKARERPGDPSGWILEAWRPFSTHFGQFL